MKNILETTPLVVQGAQHYQAGKEMTVMQQRYKQAIEFMDWFEPAWCYLK